MKTKNILLLIFVSLILVLTLQNVSSIGITPGRTTINFESGLQKDVSFSIINSEHKDMSVVFAVRGDLADYVTLTQTYSEFTKDDDSKQFTYTVNLPQKIEKPGLYTLEIAAMEAPKDIKEKGTFVGATVSVVTQLYIYVPYPDKYLDAEINTVESGGKTVFLIPVTNRGELDIVSASAIIDIYDGTETKIATIDTDTQGVKSLERKELKATWDANVNPGRYKAIVTVRYDEKVTTVLKEFNVGEMYLDVLQVNINDFNLGEIAKFDALVENKWSSDLKDAYLNIIVYNVEGEVMADFKSPTYNINGLSKSDMIAYWDTAGVHTGTYDGKLILKYGEKSTEKNIQLKITDNSIEVVGLTGHVVVSGGGGFLNTTNILIGIIIIIVLMNIVWFFVIKRILKKRK